MAVTVLILVHDLLVLLACLVVYLISLILACIGRTGSILARLCCDRLSLVYLVKCSLISSLAFDCSLLGTEMIGACDCYVVLEASAVILVVCWTIGCMR